MSLQSEVSVLEYQGNGIATDFPVTYDLLAAGDLTVYVVNSSGQQTDYSLNIDYSVAPTLDSITTVVAPPTGTTLYIERDPAVTQPTDFIDGGELLESTLETTVDRIVMLVQSLWTKVGQSLRITGGSAEELGDPATRAGLYLGFDEMGDPELVTGDDIIADSGNGLDLVAGPVTTLDPGEPATSEITGEAPVKTLLLGIPKGIPGDQGPPGLTTFGMDARTTDITLTDAMANRIQEITTGVRTVVTLPNATSTETVIPIRLLGEGYLYLDAEGTVAGNQTVVLSGTMIWVYKASPTHWEIVSDLNIYRGETTDYCGRAGISSLGMLQKIDDLVRFLSGATDEQANSGAQWTTLSANYWDSMYEGWMLRSRYNQEPTAANAIGLKGVVADMELQGAAALGEDGLVANTNDFLQEQAGKTRGWGTEFSIVSCALTSTSSVEQNIFSTIDGNNNIYWQVTTADVAKLALFSSTDAARTIADTGNSAVDGNWHEHTATWSTTNDIKIYYDGVLNGSATPTGGPITDIKDTGNRIGVGADPVDADAFVGDIAYTLVFNAELTEADVASVNSFLADY